MSRTIRHMAFGLLVAPLWAVAADANSSVLRGPSMYSAAVVLVTNTNPPQLFHLRTNAVPAPKPAPRVMAARNPSPGVYLSKPFTCIVVVPGGKIDPGILKELPPVEMNMPVVKPELKLEPKKR